MGFFGTRTATTSKSPMSVPMDSGLRLRSDRSSRDCFDTLVDLQGGYRERLYEHMPYVVKCGHRWLAGGQPPKVVVAATDSRADFLMVALWPREHGAEVGLFPLGAGVSRLQMPMGDHWLDRDGSMTKAGVIPAGSIAIAQPVIPRDYESKTLRMAGYPQTPSNVARLRDMNARQFLLKANQFLGTRDERLAQQFVSEHANSEDLTQIVTDLAACMPQALPYMQDLPWWLRALMLEPMQLAGPFWAGMER